MQPQNPMDEKEFANKYNFNNLKIVTIVNPTGDDFQFTITMETSVDVSTGLMQSASREYVIKAGSKERLPGVAANLYLDQMSKKIAQEEEKFDLYPDFAQRALLYDSLIVTVEDTFGADANIRHFSDDQVEEKDQPEEVPFGGVNNEKSESTTERTTGVRKATADRTKAVDNKAK